MAELVVVDRALVQALNHAAQPQPLRLLILLAATALAAVPALLLAGLAVRALRHLDPASLTMAVLAALGGAAALGLNQLAGHLYFRPRHYWALPAMHAIGARAGDSSFSPTTPPSPLPPRPAACSSRAAGALPPPAPPSWSL
jgi:hypothetical protein